MRWAASNRAGGSPILLFGSLFGISSCHRSKTSVDSQVSTLAPGSANGCVRLWAVRCLLVLWALGTSVVAMTLTVGHWYTMPAPQPSNILLNAAIAELRDGDGSQAQSDWTALHVLYAECRCSQRVLDHLLARAPEPGVGEVVVLVGDLPDFRSEAEARGYRVEVIEPQELGTRFGIQSAPMLVVADSAARIRYLGGYTERKQGLEILDLEILHDLRSGPVGTAEAEPYGLGHALPLFGCAVSASLQELIDPLRIKYSETLR